jgi:hypothetical protein
MAKTNLLQLIGLRHFSHQALERRFGDKQARGFLVLADFAGRAGAMTLGVGNDEVAGPHGISLNTQGFSCLTIAVSEVAGHHGIGLNTWGFSCRRIAFKTDALVESKAHWPPVDLRAVRCWLVECRGCQG